MSLDTSLVYRLAESLHLKADGDKLLILDPRTYSVHELNSSAALVAQLCDGTRACEEIVADLACAESADAASVSETVYRALQLFQQQGLLETV